MYRLLQLTHRPSPAIETVIYETRTLEAASRVKITPKLFYSSSLEMTFNISSVAAVKVECFSNMAIITRDELVLRC